MPQPNPPRPLIRSLAPAILALAALVPAAGSAAAPATKTAPRTAPAAADTGATARDPVVYLSWHQPYGMRGAAEDLTPTRVPGQRDTLWLVFETPRLTRLFGYSAQLLFHAMPPDTLGEHWHFGGGAMNPHNIVVEFPQPSWPVHGPWTIPGMGGTHYEPLEGGGRLDLIYAVNADSAGAISPGHRYAMARILFPALGAGEARQPVCIEWASGEFSFEIGGKDAHPADGGARFVSVDSPDGRVRQVWRQARRLPRPATPPAR